MEHCERGDVGRMIVTGAGTPDAPAIMRDLLRGLEALHEVGMIHRDIKPANIMVREPGVYAISDFGLARMTDAAASITQAGEVIGTPAYMAPEQIRFEPLTTKADLFSAGLVMYELFCGVKPFQAGSVQEYLIQILGKDLPPLPEKHAPFEPLLRALTTRDVNARVATASEALVLLRKATVAAL
jgi:serine/threonine protein kinase